MNNAKRIKAVKAAITTHAQGKGWRRGDVAEMDNGEALTDILADLRHFADKCNLDFAQCDRMAYQHYLVELKEVNP